MFIKKFTYTQEYVTSPSEINYEDLLYSLKSPPFQLTKNQYCINVVSTKERPGEHRVEVGSKTQHQWTKVQSSPDCSPLVVLCRW